LKYHALLCGTIVAQFVDHGHFNKVVGASLVSNLVKKLAWICLMDHISY
jgi:hypothetical protein